MLLPSAAICRTASGPALEKSWLPILNMPTRSETCLAKAKADFNESKSRATIKPLRGWASKVTVLVTPTVPGSVFLGYFQKLEPDLAHTRVDQPNLAGYAIGYINFASLLIGAPIVDAN